MSLNEKELKLRIELANRRGKNRRSTKLPTPTALERKMKSLIDDYLEFYHQNVRDLVKSQLSQSILEAEAEGVRLDSWVDDLTRNLNLSLENLTAKDQELKENFINLANDLGNFNQKNFQRAIKSTLAVDVTLNEPWLNSELRSWAEQNANFVTSIPRAEHGQISRLSLEGVRSGKNVREIQSEIEKQFSVSAGRAKTIARTETAKLNSELTKHRQKDLGVNYYYWRTARDERVRSPENSDGPYHDVLEGKLCDYDDPTIFSDDGGKSWQSRDTIGAVDLHPGEDFNCRCSAELATDLLLEKLGI